MKIIDEWEKTHHKLLHFRDGISAHDGVKVTQLSERTLTLIHAYRELYDACDFVHKSCVSEMYMRHKAKEAKEKAQKILEGEA